jgi:hypothetical protein
MKNTKYHNFCKWKQHNQNKLLAHRAVFIALRAGKLMQEDCQQCGKHKTQAHHEDYLEPLQVIWLCKKCHTKLHKGKGTFKTCGRFNSQVIYK